MGDEVREDRRAGASLRERVVIASNLREDGGHLRVEGEMLVNDEKSPNSPKVDTAKEVGKIKIENPTSASVSTSVAHYGSVALESVRDLILPAIRPVQFSSTVLKEI
jgi:hypothetical protein